MKQKKWLWVVIVFAILVIGLMGYWIGYGFTTTNNNITTYPSKDLHIKQYAEENMPELNSIGTNGQLAFIESKWNRFLIPSTTATLVVTYKDASIYEKQKLKVKEQYVFLDKPIYGSKELGESKECLIPASIFQIGSYHFNIIDRKGTVTSGLDANPYFTFMCIATSDEKQRIVYMYYFSYSRDSIGKTASEDAMIAFITKNFPNFWDE